MRNVSTSLRREGLYSSSLSTWRRQGMKRGPKAPPKDVGIRASRNWNLATAPKKADASGNDHWHRSLCRAWTTTSTTDGSGIAAASCRAFGVARSSLYRRRQTIPRAYRATSSATICCIANALWIRPPHRLPQPYWTKSAICVRRSNPGCESRTAEPTPSSGLYRPELLATGPVR